MPDGEHEGRFGWWRRWGRDAVTFVAVGLSAWAVFAVQGSVDDINKERDARADQACNIAERKQASDVEGLKRTYDYLLQLSPDQLGDPLNRAILAQLSRTEREARFDDAPAYCDEPGVGQPEPDPVVPERPAKLREKPND